MAFVLSNISETISFLLRIIFFKSCGSHLGWLTLRASDQNKDPLNDKLYIICDQILKFQVKFPSLIMECQDKILRSCDKVDKRNMIDCVT